MRVGRVIRRYRIVEEIAMRALAKEIGISASTLCRIENGEEMSGSALAKIIAWLFS